MHRSVASGACVMAFAFFDAAQARTQEARASAPTRVQVGSRVRVTTPALSPTRRESFYGGLRNDSLFLIAFPRLDSTALAVPAITRFELSDGVRTRSRRASFAWAMAGLGGGTLLGVGLGAAFFENSKGCGTYDFTGCQEEEMGMGLLGLAGGLGGVTIAYNYSRRPRERWRRVSLGGVPAR